jgi:hypothetical protein
MSEDASEKGSTYVEILPMSHDVYRRHWGVIRSVINSLRGNASIRMINRALTRKSRSSSSMGVSHSAPPVKNLLVYGCKMRDDPHRFEVVKRLRSA